MLEGKAEGSLPSLTSSRQLALVLLALRGKGWKAGLEGPRELPCTGMGLQQELRGGAGCRMTGSGRRDGRQEWPSWFL